MLAGCRCRPVQQLLLLLLLLTTAALLVMALLAVSEPPLVGIHRRSVLPPAAPVAPTGTRDRPPPTVRPPENRTQCPPPGRLLSINSAGRLGNVMSEYATLLAAGRALRRPAWLLPKMARALAAWFEPPSLPVLPAAGCPINWKVITTQGLLEEPSDSGRDLIIGGFPHDVPLFHPQREQLLRDFTFREGLRARANRRLVELARQANLSSPTFIGVHVRRTDYKVWLSRSVDGQVVGAAYLRRAVALMRRRHRSAVFVVTSDDLEWCRRELRGLQLVMVAGDRDVRRPGADLALLAACNHSVVTHGTFGFWAAYLAGGEVVAPTGYGRRPTGLERDVRRARLGWTWLPGDGGPPQQD